MQDQCYTVDSPRGPILVRIEQLRADRFREKPRSRALVAWGSWPGTVHAWQTTAPSFDLARAQADQAVDAIIEGRTLPPRMIVF